MCTFSHVELFAPPMGCSPLGFSVMEFSRQGYWTVLPSPSPWDLPYPGIKLMSLESPALASGFFTTNSTWKKAMAPHSSTLAWKTPWMEEPGGLQSGVAKSRTRLRDFTFLFPFHALEKEIAPHSSFLAWRIPGTEEPSGPLSLGSHRVGHN